MRLKTPLFFCGNIFVNRPAAELRLYAAVHEVRESMESLPVGLVEVAPNGTIVRIDPFTESLCVGASLVGKQLQDEEILGDATGEFLHAIEEKNVGYLGSFEVMTKSGVPVRIQVVLEETQKGQRFVFTIVYDVA